MSEIFKRLLAATIDNTPDPLGSTLAIASLLTILGTMPAVHAVLGPFLLSSGWSPGAILFLAATIAMLLGFAMLTFAFLHLQKVCRKLKSDLESEKAEARKVRKSTLPYRPPPPAGPNGWMG